MNGFSRLFITILLPLTILSLLFVFDVSQSKSEIKHFDVTVRKCHSNVFVEKIVKSAFFTNMYMVSGVTNEKMIDGYFTKNDIWSIRKGDWVEMCLGNNGSNKIKKLPERFAA